MVVAFSTADHPLSRLLAECQFNVCESIKPLAVATAKGGSFPTLSFLPLSRHHNDPLPSLTVSSDDTSSHSYGSTGSTFNERSHSLPETSHGDALAMASQPHLQHLHSTSATITGSNRISAVSQNDEEDDFITADVFMAGSDSTTQSNTTDHHSVSDASEGHSTGEAAENKDSTIKQQSLADDEAVYFVLEKPPKLANGSDNKGKASFAANDDDKDKVSSANYEEIDEAIVKSVDRPRSPLPYELPSWSRQDSSDVYYSNIGSPENSGYTLLSQWTRCKSEDDYTQLDPSTIINKTSAGDKGDISSLYPQLSCSVHLGKREVLEPLSEKVCLSIKEIVREINLYLGKVYLASRSVMCGVL